MTKSEKNRNKTMGGPYRKGQSGNPAGRPKGVKNKSTEEIKSVCRSLLERAAYRRRIATELLAGTLDTKIEVLLWHYAYGKPPQAIELSGSFDPAAYLASLTPDDR